MLATVCECQEKVIENMLFLNPQKKDIFEDCECQETVIKIPLPFGFNTLKTFEIV